MRRYEQVHRDGARAGYVDTRAAKHIYGIDPHALVRHLAQLGWSPYLPGLWIQGEPTFRARCGMALRYTGAQALLTGSSALHALDVLDAPSSEIHVLLPAGRWLAPRDELCVHYTSVHDRVRSVGWKGLRLARAARALADHSTHANVNSLCRVIADATRLRHCTLQQVGEEIAARGRFPGRRALRTAYVELTGELNHSRHERLGRRLLRQGGLDVPSRPGPVVHAGCRRAEIDIPFYDVRYGVEVDGPPHLLPAQAARDRARDRMLAATCGWAIDRYLWFELEEAPERFVREVVGRVTALRARREPLLQRGGAAGGGAAGGGARGVSGR